MSKKLVGIATAAALVSSVVAPYAIQAEENYQAAGQGVYVTTPEGQPNKFYSVSEVAQNPNLVVDAIRTYGGANVHFVVAGKYTTASKISSAATAGKPVDEAYVAQTPENDVPGGTYEKTDGTTVEGGKGDQTPSITVEAINTTGIFMVGDKAELPTTIDVEVTDADGETKTVKGLKVTWDGEISTEEAGFDSIPGKVEYEGKTYDVSYEYEVVETPEELEKLKALKAFEQVVTESQKELDSIDETLSYGEVSDVVTEATDATFELSEESSAGEIKAAQALVDKANKLLVEAETAITTVQKAVDEAKAKAQTAGVATEDIEDVLSNFDPSYVQDTISGLKADLAKAQDDINAALGLTLKVASVSAVNGTVTVKLAEAAKEVKASDFNVTQSINKGAATGVTVTKAVLAEDGVTVTLTVAPVEAKDVAQSVVYTVNKVAAEAFEVDAVGAELKVASVTAVNAKTLEVKFATAVVDTTKAVFEVKRGTANVSVTPEWSEDKKSVKLVAGANLLAGEHTVTVKGLTETALTGKTTVEAVKPTSLEIGTTVLTDNTEKAKLNVVLKDQYGEAIKVNTYGDFSISAYNTTQSIDLTKLPNPGQALSTINLVTLDSTEGFVVDTKSNADTFKSGDKVTVTFLHKETGLKATKELTVTAEGVVSEITLGDVVLPTGKTLLTADLTGVKIPVTAKDQYGNAVTLTGDDLELSSNNKDLLPDESANLKLTSDGKFIEIVNFNKEKSGSVTINVFAKKSGTSVNKTLDVQSAPGVVTAVELAETASTVAAGTVSKKVKLTVKDNYNTTLSVAQYKDKLSVTSTNASVVANNVQYLKINPSGELEFSVDANANEGSTTTLTINTENGKKLAEYVVTAGKKAEITSIVLDSESKHVTKLAVGADTTVAFEVLDQYESTTTLAKGYSVAYTLKDTAAGVITTADVAGVKTSVKVQAEKTGTATLVAQLKQDEKVIATREVNFEVVANNAADVTVADIAVLASGQSGLKSAYKEEVKVTTASGASLPTSAIVSVASTDNNVVKAEKHTDGKWYVYGATPKQDANGNPIDSKVTLKVVYNADDKPVTLTKEVTVSATEIAPKTLHLMNKALKEGKLDTDAVAITSTQSVSEFAGLNGLSIFALVEDNYGRYTAATTADTASVGHVTAKIQNVTEGSNLTTADTIDITTSGKLDFTNIAKKTFNSKSTVDKVTFRVLITTTKGSEIGFIDITVNKAEKK